MKPRSMKPRKKENLKKKKKKKATSTTWTMKRSLRAHTVAGTTFSRVGLRSSTPSFFYGCQSCISSSWVCRQTHPYAWLDRSSSYHSSSRLGCVVAGVHALVQMVYWLAIAKRAAGNRAVRICGRRITWVSAVQVQRAVSCPRLDCGHLPHNIYLSLVFWPLVAVFVVFLIPLCSALLLASCTYHFNYFRAGVGAAPVLFKLFICGGNGVPNEHGIQ